MDTAPVAPISLYLRLGGADAVEMVVRLVYDRAERTSGAATRRADVARLAALLGGPPANPEPGLFDAVSPAVVSHLRDALWFMGVATPLAEEIVTTVRAGP